MSPRSTTVLWENGKPVVRGRKLREFINFFANILTFATWLYTGLMAGRSGLRTPGSQRVPPRRGTTKPRHTSVTDMRHQHGGIGEDNETRFPHSYAFYG